MCWIADLNSSSTCRGENMGRLTELLNWDIRLDDQGRPWVLVGRFRCTPYAHQVVLVYLSYRLLRSVLILPSKQQTIITILPQQKYVLWNGCWICNLQNRCEYVGKNMHTTPCPKLAGWVLSVHAFRILTRKLFATSWTMLRIWDWIFKFRKHAIIILTKYTNSEFIKLL